MCLWLSYKKKNIKKDIFVLHLKEQIIALEIFKNDKYPLSWH